MNGALYSGLAGFLIAGLDLGILVALVQALGRKLEPAKAVMLSLLLMGKLGLLGLAVFWLSKADWFHAGGAIIGTGAGITLHSLGSSGGNDVIAVLLNQKFNIRMGTFFSD